MISLNSNIERFVKTLQTTSGEKTCILKITKKELIFLEFGYHGNQMNSFKDGKSTVKHIFVITDPVIEV